MKRMLTHFIRLLHSWGGKVTVSILDQVVFSVANFGLYIFLARRLSSSEYGIFAIAFSIFLFISGLYQAVVLEPMSVLGPAYYNKNLSSYIGGNVWLHIGVTSLFSLVMLMVAMGSVIRHSLFSGSFFGLVVAVPFILFFWFFRQICYIQTKPKIALMGSSTYAVILFACLFIGCKKQWLSPFSAFLFMALASLIASLLFWSFLRVATNDILWHRVKGVINKIAVENWNYGRWVMGSAFVNWLSIVVYLPMVGIVVGLSQAGVFRAMENLVLPGQRIFVAMGILLLPWLSRQRVTYGKEYIGKKIIIFMGLNVLFSIGYVAGLIIFREWVVEILYGQGYYMKFLWLLPYLGVVMVVESLTHGLYIGLKVLERPDAVFWSQAIAVGLTLTVGLYLVVKLGLYGAVLGCLISNIAVALSLTFFMCSHLRRKKV